MGIPGLWETLGEGEVTDIAAFATKHFEQTKRPLRIAVDEASWRFNCYQSAQQVAYIRNRYTPAANPNEKNILYKVLQLLRLNIQLIFVADGPKRPKKRGKIPRMLPEKETELLRKTLGHLGVPWHQAPAEAEAECAEMQRLGVVDAVWTDDGDCLMFGCQVVIRFYYNNDNMDLKKQKDLSKIRIYRASTLSAKFPSLDREGLVLWAVIGGGDYDHKGLVGCGPVRILELVKSSLGKSLCRAFENGSLQSWRKELQAQLQKGGSSVSIPEQFPNPTHVQDYYKPLVSSSNILKGLPNGWTISLNEEELWPFLGKYFNIWVKVYIELVIPILLVRALAQTKSGGEAANAKYEMKHVAKKSANTIYYTTVEASLAAITSLHIKIWVNEANSSFSDTKLIHDPPPIVQCGNILRCIIQHCAPTVLPDKAPTMSPKKRKLPPIAQVAEDQTSGSIKAMPKKRKMPSAKDIAGEPTSPVAKTSPKKRGRLPQDVPGRQTLYTTAKSPTKSKNSEPITQISRIQPKSPEPVFRIPSLPPDFSSPEIQPSNQHTTSTLIPSLALPKPSITSHLEIIEIVSDEDDNDLEFLSMPTLPLPKMQKSRSPFIAPVISAHVTEKNRLTEKERPIFVKTPTKQEKMHAEETSAKKLQSSPDRPSPRTLRRLRLRRFAIPQDS